MTDEGLHLNESVREYLYRSKPERFEFIRNVILHSHQPFVRAQERLESLLFADAPSIAVLRGPSHNGKSTLVNHILYAAEESDSRKHLVSLQTDERGHRVFVPTIITALEPGASYRKLLEAIARKLVSRDYQTIQGLDKLYKHLKTKQVGRIIIDQGERILRRSGTEATDTLELLYDIHKALDISIALVVSGNHDSRLNVCPPFKQSATFVEMPLWKCKETERDHGYWDLLDCLLRTIPLRIRSPVLDGLSAQCDTRSAMALQETGEHSIGGILELVRRAAIVAIETETEVIDAQTLKLVGVEPKQHMRR